jgi:hypothetical protein
LDSARRQAANLAAIETWRGSLGCGLALVLPVLVSRRERHEWQLGILLGALASAGALLLGSAAAIGAIAVLGLTGAALVFTSRQPPFLKGWQHIVGLALLVGWLAGLFFSTPLYTPYLRLLLPWFLSAWLAAAVAAQWVVHAETASGQLRGTRRIVMLVTLSLAGIVVALLQPRSPTRLDFGGRRGVERIAEQLVKERAPESRRAIYVYGEPALFFQLCAAGEELVAPVATLPSNPVPVDGQAITTCLIVGPHSRSDAALRQQLAAAKEWRFQQRFEYRPSPLVWLDLHDPRQAGKDGSVSEESFELYESVP